MITGRIDGRGATLQAEELQVRFRMRSLDFSQLT
jgi:hypothetical protein